MSVLNNRRAVAMTLAATIAVGLPFAAAAQSVHLHVGDLSQPDAARSLDVRLQAAARRICADNYRPTELAGEAACETVVRADALAQLSPEQRQAYQAAVRPASRRALASR